MAPAGAYEFLVALLLVIVVLFLLARRLRLPSAALFIVGGAALALVPGVPTFSVPPDLVMLVFLPPLLMNSGYFIRGAVTDRATHAQNRHEHHEALVKIIVAGRAEALRLHANGAIHDDMLRLVERDFDLQQIISEIHCDEALKALNRV